MSTRPPLQDRILERLAAWQTNHPWLVIAVLLLVTVPAGIAARGLGLKTDFAQLLPENKSSVVEMRRVSKKLTSASTLTIVATGQDTEALKRFVDAASPKIRALGPEWVGAVDDGVKETRQFLEENKFLYANYEDVKKLHEEILARYDYEVSKAAGTDLGLDDEEAPAPLSADSIKKRVEEARSKQSGADKFPGGYYLGENGKTIVMFVRTPVEGGSVTLAPQLRARIDKIVSEVNPASLDPTMKVLYTGDFITSVEEYNGIRNDLASVGVWGVGMVLGVVLLFFLHARTLVAIALSIGMGLVWTFGATRFTVGYLNTSTGFLVSIIAGNGINFSIIYMARYLEARRAQGLGVAEAIRVAHRSTWLATLAAAGAAMVAYGSLAVTDFKGFKHFGVIGGMGMMVCWVCTYLALPAVLVASERLWPLFRDRQGWQSKARGFYGFGFAWLINKFPRAVVVVGLAAGALGLLTTIRYMRADPMEYDLANLRNENRGESTARSLSTRVDKIVGRMGQDGMAVMVDRLDQVEPYKRVLEDRLASAPADEKPFDKVVTAYSLLPDRQQDKLVLLQDVLDRIQRARAKGVISNSDWSELEPQLPKDLKTLTLADLPERMMRPFTEADGTRGRIIYIVPKTGRSIWDAKYLELWAASFREVKLPSGETIIGSGRAVIFADMMQAVREDAPKAILVSLLGTIAVVLIAFRFRRTSWAVLGTLLLGLSGLGAFLFFKDIKLNFLNFVALPITIGVGVDYAVNMMKRIEGDPEVDIKQVVIETGGAVILCSLTTVVGYLALLFSTNQAIARFGMTAAAGEVTSLVAAVVILPAALVWRARSRARTNLTSDRPPPLALESPSPG